MVVKHFLIVVFGAVLCDNVSFLNSLGMFFSEVCLTYTDMHGIKQ